MDEGRHALNQARQRFGERTPLETLISIPVLTAQDVIQHFLNQHSDPVTRGDTDLMPLGRNVREPPAWLPGAPQFRPTNYRPPSDYPELPSGAPQTYGPSNPYNQSSSSSSSSSAAPPQAASSSSSSSSAHAPAAPAVPYTVYNDVDEWLDNVKNRGALVEQIYKRPGWARAMGVENSRGYSSEDQSRILRQKLKQMSRRELARILIHLDEQAGHRRSDS
jgi:hypothetical protein